MLNSCYTTFASLSFHLALSLKTILVSPKVLSKLFLPVVCFILQISFAVAQAPISLSKDEKIKTENNLQGIKVGKTWNIPPVCTKIEVCGHLLFCYKNGLTDVYRNTLSVKPKLAENLTEKQLQMFREFANIHITPVPENDKWGFKTLNYQSKVEYDQLFKICIENSAKYEEMWECNYLVGVKKDGKTGVLNADGKFSVSPDDYIDIVYKRLKQGINGHVYLLICTKRDGSRDFFDPTQNKQLPGFASEYDIIAGDQNENEEFWRGLRVFRGSDNRLGLITHKGKLFLPASASKINFLGNVITCNNNKVTVFKIGTGLTEIRPDTVSFSTINYLMQVNSETSLEFTTATTIGEYPKDIKRDYNYELPETSYYKCTSCGEHKQSSYTCKKCGKKTVSYETFGWNNISKTFTISKIEPKEEEIKPANEMESLIARMKERDEKLKAMNKDYKGTDIKAVEESYEQMKNLGEELKDKISKETDALIQLIKIAGNKNVKEIMDTARILGITNFTKGESKRIHPLSRKEENCVEYKSHENILNGKLPLFIYEFASGDINIFFLLQNPHFKSLNDKLKSSGLKQFEKSGNWQNWGNEKGVIRLVDIDGPSGNYGGDCNIYSR